MVIVTFTIDWLSIINILTSSIIRYSAVFSCEASTVVELDGNRGCRKSKNGWPGFGRREAIKRGWIVAFGRQLRLLETFPTVQRVYTIFSFCQVGRTGKVCIRAFKPNNFFGLAFDSAPHLFKSCQLTVVPELKTFLHYRLNHFSVVNMAGVFLARWPSPSSRVLGSALFSF